MPRRCCFAARVGRSDRGDAHAWRAAGGHALYDGRIRKSQGGGDRPGASRGDGKAGAESGGARGGAAEVAQQGAEALQERARPARALYEKQNPQHGAHIITQGRQDGRGVKNADTGQDQRAETGVRGGEALVD
eukprot:70583-Rhodomonas_salina.1